MQREYAAFISYRHKPLDIAVATKLHKNIERFKIPRDLRREAQKNPEAVFGNWDGAIPERLLVFRDRDELPLSNDLTSDIFDALDNAKCLVVICTPDTPKSLWVRREISHFIEKHGRKRIVTVLAAGTPEESIPKEITHRFAEDGVTVLEEYEPLVAYLVADSQREVLKKLDQETLRVAAALLGCPYDALKQRHKRRRMQQALAVAAAAFLVALSFIGVLVNRNMEILAQKQEVENQKLQVEVQKQEAEAQRRMVQLRESELLAADARAALEIGNAQLAVEKAVAALPKAGEEDRPYYAPAESVLMEAMGVLTGGRQKNTLSDIILEQMTPVYNLAISNDGSVVVTIDEYGVLHGFDSAGGQELWTDIITADVDNTDVSYVQVTQDDSCLISVYDEVMEGRELRTGRLLWRYDMNFAADGYFIYDGKQNRIAVLHAYSSAEESLDILELAMVSAETGEEIQRIRLEQREEMVMQTIHDAYQPRMAAGGAFSEDGRYFACAFSREHQDDGKTMLMCFVADLQEGCLAADYQKEILYPGFDLSGMGFYEDGLVMVLEPDDDSLAGMLMKLDWQNGRVLWQTATPSELDMALVSSGRAAYTILAKSVILVGKYNKVYAVDVQSGKILHTATFPGNVTAMYSASDYYFGFALKDGTYAIGMYSGKNGFTLTTDNFFDVWARVGEHSLLQGYGGGIVQYYSDGNYVELSVSNVEKPGYVALVPKDNANQVIIKRPVATETVVVPTAIDVPVEADRLYCGELSHTLMEDDTLVFGHVYYYGDSYDTHYRGVRVDTQTGEVTEVFDMEVSGNATPYFLRDGSGYIVQENYAGSGSDAAYLQDGTVLSVQSDAQTITVQRDGQTVATVDLPESHVYTGDAAIWGNRYVLVGRNGYVMTHKLADVMGQTQATDLAIYNSAAGTWQQMMLDVPLTNTDACALGQSAAVFAAVDGEHTVRVWDLQTGEETAAFPLQLPYNSVMHMDFLLDDSCLMVKTRDAKVLVYEIATGQILLQDQMKTSFRGSLMAQEDPVNQRLYIWDSYLNGINALCVDLRSWTVLSKAENVVCYVPQTNELYCMNSGANPAGDCLYSIQVPDMNALVQLGQQFLEKN